MKIKKFQVEVIFNYIYQINNEYWLRTFLCYTENKNLWEICLKSISLSDQLPVLYISAENKLLRRYYSLCKREKFTQVKLDLVDYVVYKEATEQEPLILLSSPYENNMELTLVPNKKYE